jgi:polyphosphate kinase
VLRREVYFPEFELMVVRAGIQILKYWFSISDEEQERRFQSRNEDPTRRWKLSPMDLEARERWQEFSRAKDDMFAHTDTKQVPLWVPLWVVDADVNRHARLNCISHLLSQVPYEDRSPDPMPLPPRPAPPAPTSARRCRSRRSCRGRKLGSFAPLLH